ncbi:hypothetical protein BDZ89DRAFT_1063464 [Hymenopellis radicata]|nr:hypothetical protein BDZ89DRAFT_1063464 [Hymenopellis radicata]
MQQIASQCTSCGAFPRRSLHHDEEYQSSVLLERLRTTNFPPTDEEISHVRHTILPTVSDDISSIESKLVSLREVITLMEEERERLINVQMKYNDLISLHRTLPLEIWSQIFLYTLSSASDSNAFDASGSIWRLSHVCQSWRNIALSLHSFWSTMDLRWDVQRLEMVIQRSRQGLLDVSLSDNIRRIRRPDSNPSILKCMLDIVLAESYRWRVLNLSDDRGRLNMLYAPLHNRLPRLQCLSLDCAHIQPKEQSVFKDCPRLTKLTLGASPSAIEFPWDQITELDLSRMYSDDREEERRESIRLIGQCPKLDATSVAVIDALTLPRLRDVSFHPDLATADYALYSFKQLLIRSNCLSALTNLSLASVPFAASPADCTLHSILSQTHSLAFLGLAVTVGEFDDEMDGSDRQQIVTIVQSLKVIPAKTVTFLPLLSSLDIRIHNHDGLTYFGPVSSFASMLKARWKGDDTVGLARLRTCHFAVDARHVDLNGIYRGNSLFAQQIFSEAERLIFDALVDDGMDLAIRVTSAFTESVGGNSVVFAVSR